MRLQGTQGIAENPFKIFLTAVSWFYFLGVIIAGRVNAKLYRRGNYCKCLCGIRYIYRLNCENNYL